VPSKCAFASEDLTRKEPSKAQQGSVQQLLLRLWTISSPFSALKAQCSVVLANAALVPQRLSGASGTQQGVVPDLGGEAA
jgi:hypothetical protein